MLEMLEGAELGTTHALPAPAAPFPSHPPCSDRGSACAWRCGNKYLLQGVSSAGGTFLPPRLPRSSLLSFPPLWPAEQSQAGPEPLPGQDRGGPVPSGGDPRSQRQGGHPGNMLGSFSSALVMALAMTASYSIILPKDFQ